MGASSPDARLDHRRVIGAAALPNLVAVAHVERLEQADNAWRESHREKSLPAVVVIDAREGRLEVEEGNEALFFLKTHPNALILQREDIRYHRAPFDEAFLPVVHKPS